MSKWLQPIARTAHAARHRLICFPYAGAGPSLFKAWREYVPSDMEVLAVHLPGREGRYAEAASTDLSWVVESITDAIQALPSCPLTLFGHSLGALIAYEVVQSLEAKGVQPHLLIASGRHCPGTPSKTKPISHLPNAEFLQAMSQYGGMSPEILACEELLEILLPAIRADFTLSEQYHKQPSGRKVNTPILVLGSQDDALVDYDKLETWKTLSESTVNVHAFAGGHFFLQTRYPQIIDLFLAQI